MDQPDRHRSHRAARLPGRGNIFFILPSPPGGGATMKVFGRLGKKYDFLLRKKREYKRQDMEIGGGKEEIFYCTEGKRYDFQKMRLGQNIKL